MVGDWYGVVVAFLAVDAAVVVVGVTLTARDATRRRGSWWAAFDRSRCEECGEPSPVGLPQSSREALRRLGGGWSCVSCVSCGLVCDKWGAAVGSKAR